MSFASVRQCFIVSGRSASRLSVLSAAVAGVVGMSAVQAAPTIVPASHDAEVREQVPEFTRGKTRVEPSTSTQEFEMQISSNPNSGGNRQVGIMRFTVPNTITSVAQLDGGFADLQLVWRLNQNQGGGSIRWYGLNPLHADNTTWNEQTVHYRDAGSHQNTSVPTSGVNNGVNALLTPSPVSQPSPGSILDPILGPTAPISSVAGYGATMASPGRIPGLLYEAPPFSAQVESENQARYNYNLAERQAFLDDLGDDGEANNSLGNGTPGSGNHPGAYGYVSYKNQPGYNVGKQTTGTTNNGDVLNTFTPGTENSVPVATRNAYAFSQPASGYLSGVHNDVTNANRPYWSGPLRTGLNSTDTSNDDLDMSQWSLLGHTDIIGGSKTIGTTISFTSTLGGFTSTTHAQMQYNLSQLLAFLESGLSNGVHDFTFLITTGTGAAAGVNGPTAEWLVSGSPNSGNQQFATSEFMYAGPGGVMLSGAPRLVLSPEPATAVSLFSLAALGMIRARRRSA